MHSKIREELHFEDLVIAASTSAEDKLNQALELSDLCLELKESADKNASEKNS